MATVEQSTQDDTQTAGIHVAEVVAPMDANVVETVTVTEPGTSVGAEEVVIPMAGGEASTNTAVVMQSIIEALTSAASETAGLANDESTVEESSKDKEKEIPEDVPVASETEEGDGEDPNGIAAAAAALQVLANKASTLSPGESITQLQQVLQQSLQDLPSTVATLVNDVAQEVVVMAKAAHHATMAAESMIDLEPEKVKRTKSGKLKIHKCSECGKGFTLKVTLMRHLDLHTKELNCEHCNKVFFSPVKLAAHIKHHHTPWHDRERSSVCPECGKGFYNNSKLKVHMRVHTGERPYACSFCEKTFQCSSHCKRHERLHTGEHPYVCETCGKGFGSPSNLKDHIYTHTKETPYKCEKCDRGFAQWGALQRHVAAVHEKKKECKCESCGKSFARKDYLRYHMQKCHWHRCGLCKSSFEEEATFLQHVKECTYIPEVGINPQRSPQSAKVTPRRSPSKSPRKRPATEPQKRPASSTLSTPRKRRHVQRANVSVDPTADLLSVYDQFDDDPLADPDYDAFEDGEEILEEEGVQVESEEILEQEEISQLEDIATGEIKILTRSADVEEPIITGGVDESENVAAESNEEITTSEAAEMEQGETETESITKRGQAGSETTLDSLVSALMTAASRADEQDQGQSDKKEE